MLMSKCKGDKQGPEACKRDVTIRTSNRYSTYIKYVALDSENFAIQILASLRAVFSLTLAGSPMASSSSRWPNNFLNYSPRLASYILVEKAKTEERKCSLFFKNCFRKQQSSHA